METTRWWVAHIWPGRNFVELPTSMGSDSVRVIMGQWISDTGVDGSVGYVEECAAPKGIEISGIYGRELVCGTIIYTEK